MASLIVTCRSMVRLPAPIKTIMRNSVCGFNFNKPTEHANMKFGTIDHQLLLLLLLPNLFRGMGAWRRSWSPRSRETPQGWDQRSERDRESPKSERRKESVAGQCRIKSEVSWDECPQALQDGFSILPILER